MNCRQMRKNVLKSTNKKRRKNNKCIKYTEFNVETLKQGKTSGEQVFTIIVDVQEKDKTDYNTFIQSVPTTHGSWHLLLHTQLWCYSCSFASHTSSLHSTETLFYITLIMVALGVFILIHSMGYLQM